MTYFGDLTEDATIDFKFTTRDFDTGAPQTLGGTPALSVYKANGTTESTAGITLTADFDSRTGLNHVRIDTSADAFYATGNDYDVVITTGTVDSVSVVGEVVGSFSIENRDVNVARWAANDVTASSGNPDVNVESMDDIDLSATMKASVNTEVDTALTDIHMDHLLAADYDPASPPGVATALLNELIESDGGVSRFTSNALEQIWQVATRVLTANTNLNDPTAAAIRTEIDSNSTQLAAIVGDTNELQGDWANGGRLDLILDAIAADAASLDDTKIPDTISLANINAQVDSAFTTQMADSVPADGTIATREQALYMMLQFLSERAVVGTTMTVRKVDGSTALMTFTLDDATNPTDITRAT